MRKRLTIMATAIALVLAPIATVGVAAAAAAERPAIGPPLGSYLTDIRTCQKDPHAYYHERAFYNACQNAKKIVEDQGRWDVCDAITDAGIIATITAKATGTFDGWAAVGIISGMGLACEL